MSIASRVAAKHLSRRAYDEVGRSPYGYDPGHVEPFKPTEGEGSQVPFARDHQGKPVAPPDLGLLKIPGYEWHDTSKAFHQVVQKNASNTEMFGIDVRSISQRRIAWWQDFVALVKEYWSLQKFDVTLNRNGIRFQVLQNGLRNIEVRGPIETPTVYVGGTGKKFDATTSLWEMVLWMDSVCRNGFTASKNASEVTLEDVAAEITKANEALHDAADMLDARARGPSLADTYGEAAYAVGVLHTISHTLANIERKLESVSRGRTASGGMDLAKEMRTLQKSVIDHIQTEHSRVETLVASQFKANKFLVKGVQVQQDRGWLNVVGVIVDDADTWRSREEVDALFMTMFDTYGQLSGSSPNWKFTMGGFQSY